MVRGFWLACKRSLALLLCGLWHCINLRIINLGFFYSGVERILDYLDFDSLSSIPNKTSHISSLGPFKFRVLFSSSLAVTMRYILTGTTSINPLASSPASTNKEPPRHLSKQPSHHTCYTSWSRGHNLQSVHHNSFTKPGHPSAQSAPSYCTPLSCNKQLKQDKLQFNNDNNDNRGSDGGGYW